MDDKLVCQTVGVALRCHTVQTRATSRAYISLKVLKIRRVISVTGCIWIGYNAGDHDGARVKE
jgi:hypothetical protein